MRLYAIVTMDALSCLKNKTKVIMLIIPCYSEFSHYAQISVRNSQQNNLAMTT